MLINENMETCIADNRVKICDNKNVTISSIDIDKNINEHKDINNDKDINDGNINDDSLNNNDNNANNNNNNITANNEDRSLEFIRNTVDDEKHYNVDGESAVKCENDELKYETSETIDQLQQQQLAKQDSEEKQNVTDSANRRGPKPRFGVKVPYRNLTSQIVSQDEIAQEILERSLQKYSYDDVPEGGDLFFARTIAYRLANKIAPNCSVESDVNKDKPTEPLRNTYKSDENSARSIVDPNTNNNNKNNSNDTNEIFGSSVEASLKNMQNISRTNESTRISDNAIIDNRSSVVLNSVCSGSLFKEEKIEAIKNDSKIRAASSSASTASTFSCSSKASNVCPTMKNEMDNETLIAILEGTVDGTDILPLIVGKTQAVATKRRKTTKENGMDPKLEKELALKQLRDFDQHSKRKRNNDGSLSEKRIKLHDTKINNNNNNNNNNNIGQVGISSSDHVAGENTLISKTSSTASCSPSKKNTKYKYNAVPRRLPKKYHRIIKKQMQNYKRNNSSESTSSANKRLSNDTPKKKLPEVPEVKIAIDRYIKTYANKRKSKSNAIAESSINTTNTNANSNTNTNTTITTPAEINIDPDNVNDEKPIAINDNNLVDPKPNGELIKNGDEISIIDNNNSTIDDCRRTIEKTKIIDKPNDDNNNVSLDDNINTTNTNTNTTNTNTNGTSPTVTNRELTRSKQMLREMNRLLGDEGAINMLYAIEQERTTRDGSDQQSGLPSLRRKKKDLLLRTKLVKNAILKNAVLPRFGRKKNSSDIVKTKSSPMKKSPKTYQSPAVIPPRTVVAADASKIIRRHSSSSSSGEDESTTTSAVTVSLSNLIMTRSSTVVTRSSDRATEEVAELSSSLSDNANGATPTRANIDLALATSTPAAASSSSTRLDEKSLKNNDDPVIKTVNKGRNKFETKNVPWKKQSSSRVVYGKRTGNQAGPSRKLSDDRVEDVIISKYDDSALVKVILTSSSAKMKNAWNRSLLKELIKALNTLENDASCHAVLVTSTGSYFCQGIDVSTFICADPTERRKIVEEFVNLLSDFVKCLAHFSKPLIAGISGAAVGIGVTVLPFFDIVFASDKATFCTPYAKLGHVPEAGATLTLPAVLGTAVTNELLFACRMLTASEALQFGLITRVLWPDKFSEELLTLSKLIAEKSIQSLKATKLLLRQDMRLKLDDALKAERSHLIEHWCSQECQTNFVRYLDEEAVCTFC